MPLVAPGSNTKDKAHLIQKLRQLAFGTALGLASLSPLPALDLTTDFFFYCILSGMDGQSGSASMDATIRRSEGSFDASSARSDHTTDNVATVRPESTGGTSDRIGISSVESTDRSGNSDTQIHVGSTEKSIDKVAGSTANTGQTAYTTEKTNIPSRTESIPETTGKTMDNSSGSVNGSLDRSQASTEKTANATSNPVVSTVDRVSKSVESTEQSVESSSGKTYRITRATCSSCPGFAYLNKEEREKVQIAFKRTSLIRAAAQEASFKFPQLQPYASLAWNDVPKQVQSQLLQQAFEVIDPNKELTVAQALFKIISLDEEMKKSILPDQQKA